MSGEADRGRLPSPDMVSGDLTGRLGALPGVATCTVTEETVALLVHAHEDARLLRARAQVLCAEAGERRPLVVVGGIPGSSAPGPRPGAAGRFMTAAHRRVIAPVGVAVASLFVLSLVAVVPVDEGRGPGPRRIAAPPGLALAPPSAAMPESATAVPTVETPPAPSVVEDDSGPSVVLAIPGQEAALALPTPGAPPADTASSLGPAPAPPPAATVAAVSAPPAVQSDAAANSTPVEAPAPTARSTALVSAVDSAPLATTSAGTEQRSASRQATSLDEAQPRVVDGDGAKAHEATTGTPARSAAAEKTGTSPKGPGVVGRHSQ